MLGFQESRIPGFQDSIMLRVWDSRSQEFRIPGVEDSRIDDDDDDDDDYR